MIKTKILLSLFILSLIITFGCDFNSSSDNSEDPNLGKVRITLPDTSGRNASYVVPRASEDPLLSVIRINSTDDIVCYEITLTCSSLNFTKTITGQKGETITFTKLYQGRYTMEIIAYDKPYEDSTKRAIFGGINDAINVMPRMITTATVVLRDLIGDSYLANSPPWKPKDFAYEIINDNQVDLTWEDNSVIEDGYRIYKMVYPLETEFTLIAEVLPDTMAYSDLSYTANNGETWYRVCAYNEFGESDYAGLHFPMDVVTVFDSNSFLFDDGCVFEP